MAVSKRLRYEILRRDNHTCQYCGRRAPEVKLTVDHVVPKALGGSDDPSNLLTACSECNSGKTSSNPDAPLVAEVDQRAAQWSQALEIAIERRQVALKQERARVDRFDKVWRSWPDMDREPGWRASIARFLSLGLDDRFLAEAVEIAMGNRHVRSKDVWKYFCGICWREVEAIQKQAGDLIGAGDPASQPAGDGLPPQFDQMNVAARFLPGVVMVFLGDEDKELARGVSKLVDGAFWDAMSTAYSQFTSVPSGDIASERSDVLEALVRAAIPKLQEASNLVDKELGFHGEE